MAAAVAAAAATDAETDTLRGGGAAGSIGRAQSLGVRAAAAAATSSGCLSAACSPRPQHEAGWHCCRNCCSSEKLMVFLEGRCD